MLRMYVGYLIALGLAADVTGSAWRATHGRPLWAFGDGAWFLSPLTLVLGGEFWVVGPLIPNNRREWIDRLRRVGKTPWYGFWAGAVVGAVIGFVGAALLALEPVLGILASIILCLAGPLAAVVWVYRLDPDPENADYDDAMRPAAPGSPEPKP